MSSPPAPAPLTDSPTSSDSDSPPAPPKLSPDVVASLQLDLSWLDLRTPPSLPSSSKATSTSASDSGRATPLATLAARRITTQLQRPPLPRRRSKSLDDVKSHASSSGASTPDEWRREMGMNGYSGGEEASESSSVLRLDMAALQRAKGGLEVPPSATSASSRTASVARSVVASTVVGNGADQVSQPTRRRRSKAEDEAEEDRLAEWVRRTSSSSASSAGSAAAPVAAAPSPRLGTPGKVALPPRQPYAPVLPSPLSTCSYTSEDDAREEDDGFPFPSTPHPSTSTPTTASTTQSESSSPAAEAKPPTATPRKSPQLKRRPSNAARPSYHSYPSASTVTSSTATAVSTPAGPPGPPSASSSPSSALNRVSACSREPPLLARSATDPLPPPSTASAPSPSAASPVHAIATLSSSASTRARSHTRGTSVSSSSQRPPLTPPESLSISPHLYAASAAELAWHDVLNARFGALAVSDLRFPQTGGMSFTGGSGSTGAGRAEGRNGGNATTPDQDSGRRGGWCGNELMGNAAAGGFATSTKEHLAGMLEEFVGMVPLGEGEETLHIVEYGALNSRSAGLVPPVIAHFANRELHSNTSVASSGDPDELLNFQVTHVDKPTADFRCLTEALDTRPDSYLRKQVDLSDVDLDGRVFSTFAARPSGVKVLPKKTVSVGFSAMSLHWPATDRKFRVAPATLAHGELMAFLSARASEFKPGGLLTLAYIARSEEAALASSSPQTSSPGAGASNSVPESPVGSPPSHRPLLEQRRSSEPHIFASLDNAPSAAAPAQPTSSVPVQTATKRKDIWAHLTGILGKAIQRLVSTNLLKPQIARQLLALPLHPRTPRQTNACLRASAHSWDTLKTEIVTISHPAWKGVEHGTVSVESWADYTIQLLKIFWEDEMRGILREVLGSRSACEWTLESLWTFAKEKVEEQPPHPLELEVQLIALRRRNRPPSVPTSPIGGQAPALPGKISIEQEAARPASRVDVMA
ncbi:GPCR, family 3, metabotropic glutamate receptor 5 [Rhodotorula toruloides]|uniref:BY PROTMAP: gi/472581652/gb/EMS19375.1/ GPCR,family 3, metabotropic glutamate receptor 5 [Rhodosporidium toruloides NP11] gi/647398385/emb/CDR42244.1/ RHTO0S06e11474g1_1 [Rhodosporidium toruloides] n=1 Tax=Rhodotorula toruloides TaxID=5286 RepID=A0A0K3C9C7_RHOTO|nr:GPCR, family 3, metabotropic glutamate receptor 5 [Rhodotorula toruloides]